MTMLNQGRGTAWAALLGQMELKLADFLARVETLPAAETPSSQPEIVPRPDPFAALLLQTEEQAASTGIALRAASESLVQWLETAKAASEQIARIQPPPRES